MPTTQPKPKMSVRQPAKLAKGGTDKMFKPQAAGPAKPGQTGKQQRPAPGAQGALGGAMPRSGGVSKPAAPAHTGPPGTPARQSTRDYGGLARPAKPGQTGC